MTLYIAPIVEGQTEAGCIERLLQRIWMELLGGPERMQVLPRHGEVATRLCIRDETILLRRSRRPTRI